MDKKKRIVITGIGVVTPIGIGKDVFWENALNGTCGINPLVLEGKKGVTEILCGQVDDFKARNYIENRKSLKVMSKDMQMSVAAAKLAVEDSGLDLQSVDPTMLGVSIGAGMIHSDLDELGLPISESCVNGKFDITKFAKQAQTLLYPLWLLKQLPNMLASHISIINNAQGPSNSLTTSSSAGLQAIGEADRIIERDDARWFICGGADHKVHPLEILKYDLLHLLYDRSKKSLPDVACAYDRRRSGLIPGEAAVVVVIEDLQSAVDRNASIYGEIIGYGSSGGVTVRDTDPEKCSYIESISILNALDDAGLTPDRIDCIFGHGSSSVVGDAAEIMAYKKALGNAAYNIPITSVVPMVGFNGAALGPLNLVCALLAMRDSKLFPTLFLEDPDPVCDLDIVRGAYRDHEVSVAMVNTFDFAGQGATMIVKKYEG
ncbi:MAG: beta-ketoacyl-[acyl-carrier-protein] synthase family protein [Candidatus Auribacterota bacterium]|jgi:3-oxoacyl-[acyl-carrier-protein] synthase II|nr:beta-ketoacyl-[acyl-carrier-protein] synthase family protein [Candidatus Auribacterota bacterium]